MRVGKFEVYETPKGKWRLRLKAGNGEIIAQGEEYETKQGCLKGVASIQKNASRAEIEIIEKNGKEVLKPKQLVNKLVHDNEEVSDEKRNKDERKLLIDPDNNPTFKWRKIPLPGENGPKWL